MTVVVRISISMKEKVAHYPEDEKQTPGDGQL